MSIRFVARRPMLRIHAYIASRTQLHDFVKRFLARFPFLDRRLRAIIRAERVSQFQAIPTRATHIGLAELTPRAHQVYLNLTKALRRVQ